MTKEEKRLRKYCKDAGEPGGVFDCQFRDAIIQSLKLPWEKHSRSALVDAFNLALDGVDD